jgi:hypothetical protein
MEQRQMQTAQRLLLGSSTRLQAQQQTMMQSLEMKKMMETKQMLLVRV